MPRTAVFAAGMAYLMLLVSDLNWSKELIFPLIGLRAVAVGLVAWLRYRRERKSEVFGPGRMFEPTAHGETAAMMVITRRPAAEAVSNDSATEINATPPMVFIDPTLGRDTEEINEILRVLSEGCRLPFSYTEGMDVLNPAFAELGDST